MTLDRVEHASLETRATDPARAAYYTSRQSQSHSAAGDQATNPFAERDARDRARLATQRAITTGPSQVPNSMAVTGPPTGAYAISVLRIGV
jgi:anti-sigma factor RsiW